MARLLRCDNGHQWSEAAVSDETTAHISDGCPICGQQGVALQDCAAGDAKTQEMTLGTDSRLEGPTELTTLASEDGQHSSDRTAPTIAASEFDSSGTAVSEGGNFQSGQEQATLPLSPSEAGVQERTEGNQERCEGFDRTEEDKKHGGDADKTMDRTQATAFARPTDAPQVKGQATGKRAGGGATTVKRGKAPRLPDKIAGYDILGELGRGGMGVVYKARQVGLNRICALKMILAGGLASDDSIKRFRIEAEAIAKLQHPNIVQVYEIGKAADCPYFSLEFVDGSSLQTKIASTPQPPAETARLMQQICEGVQAAHARGVLHRDLKPANILLTKDNVPKITDFGLAKRIEDKDHGQTRTGAILGTPSYMAPEQAMGRAKAVGPAADIYSLGAVLYDMLTGRPPFRGETVMDTLNQVQKMEPLPPRELAPNIPIDLQTICLKALQKEPNKRYATAGEMAEDLRRFLAGEPILARPTPAWERGIKWAKRRPALATAVSVSSVALVTVVTFAFLWLNTQKVAAEEKEIQKDKLYSVEKQAKEKAFDLKKLADDKRQLAEKREVQARVAVKEMLSSVGGQVFRFEPHLEQVRRGLVEKALGFYLDFLRDSTSDPRLRPAVADTYLLVGSVYKDLGNYEDALKQYQLALEQYVSLEREDPTNEGSQAGVAVATMERAYVRQLQSQLSESEKDYRQALELFVQLTKKAPKKLNYKDDIASIYDNLGTLSVSLGNIKQAETYFDESLRARTALMEEGGKDAEYRKRLARLDRNRGTLFVLVGKLPEAEKSLKQSREIAKALTKEAPDVPDYANDWAASSMNLAICFRKMNQSQLAVDSLREAIGLLEGLKADYPRTPIFGQELARATYEMGMVLGDKGEIQQAKDEFAKAIQLQEQLLAKQPKLAALRLQLAQSRVSMGIALSHLEKMDEALGEYRRGVQLLEDMKPSARPRRTFTTS